MDFKKFKILEKYQFRWLVTGISGFIGKNILEYLISNNQIVYGLDKNNIDQKHLNKIFSKNSNKKKKFYIFKR